MPITLTREQMKQVDEALDAIKAAKSEVIRAKQAGIPIEDQEAQLNNQESRLLAIKRVYTPQRKSS